MFKVIRDYMIFYKIHMAEKDILDDLGSEQKWTKQLWSNKIMSWRYYAAVRLNLKCLATLLCFKESYSCKIVWNKS